MNDINETADTSTNEVNSEANHPPQENTTGNDELNAVTQKKNSDKGLKEYLLDALMIFLAVALGFISENIIENIIEVNRTKVFAVALIDDLKSDTPELKRIIGYQAYASANIDSLLHLFLTKPLEVPTGKLYWYGRGEVHDHHLFLMMQHFNK